MQPPPATNDRMQKLQAMLERSPTDTFLLYAIAMEHKKAGNNAEALGFLDRVIRQDAGYCVAYHQAGLVHEAAGDVAAAKQAYHDGIAAATRKGDLHAAEEMKAALMMLD